MGAALFQFIDDMEEYSPAHAQITGETLSERVMISDHLPLVEEPIEKNIKQNRRIIR